MNMELYRLGVYLQDGVVHRKTRIEFNTDFTTYFSRILPIERRFCASTFNRNVFSQVASE